MRCAKQLQLGFYPIWVKKIYCKEFRIHVNFCYATQVEWNLRLFRAGMLSSCLRSNLIFWWEFQDWTLIFAYQLKPTENLFDFLIWKLLCINLFKVNINSFSEGKFLVPNSEFRGSFGMSLEGDCHRFEVTPNIELLITFYEFGGSSSYLIWRWPKFRAKSSLLIRN
jgi:hypothetical protein